MRTIHIAVLTTLLHFFSGPSLAASEVDRALVSAAVLGDPVLAARILAMGADVNFADEDGWTALAHAAAGYSVPTARLLVSKGAKIAEKGTSPLAIAVVAGSSETAGFLANGTRSARAWNEAVETAATRGDTRTLRAITSASGITKGDIQRIGQSHSYLVEGKSGAFSMTPLFAMAVLDECRRQGMFEKARCMKHGAPAPKAKERGKAPSAFKSSGGCSIFNGKKVCE